jgi:hypothetical protein
MGRRGAWAVVAVLLCGCTPAAQVEDPPAASSVAPQPDLQGSLLQFRRDAEARRIQVRLTAARDGVVVTSVELSVDGWTPPPVRDRRTELPAGRPLDLELTLTAPDCAAVPTSVAARVSLAGQAEPQVVPLDDGGLLRRLHEAECADEALLEQVRIEVVSLAEVADRGVLRATVRLTRLAGRDAVRVTGVGPNTVYTITPAGDLPTLAGGGSADLVLDLLPARCDVHALGESYRTSLVDLRIALGDAEPRPFVLAPSEPVRRRIESFAVETCLARDP